MTVEDQLLVLTVLRSVATLFVVASLLIYSVIRVGKLKLSMLYGEFFFVALVLFAFVHLLVPQFQMSHPEFYRLGTYSFDVGLDSFWVSSLFLFFFVLVSLIIHSSVSVRAYCFRGLDSGLGSNVYFFFTLILIPATLALFVILNLVFTVGVGTFLQDRIALLRGYGAVALLLNLYVFIGLYFFINYVRSGGLWNGFVFFVFSGFLLVVFSLVGSRNSFFVYVTCLFFCYLYVGGKLSYIKIFVYAAVVFVFLSVVGYLRVRVNDDVSNLGAEVNFVHALISVFGTDEIINYLIENGFVDWQMGDTFLAALANFIPRGIWEGKPLGAGPLLTNFINPGAYSLDGSNMSSYTTGIIAESYINFYILGPVIAGSVLAVAGYYVQKIPPINFYAICLKSYFMSMFAFAIFYSEFLGLIARAFYVSFPMLVLYLLLGRKKGVVN